jgi:hypothetical protein
LVTADSRKLAPLLWLLLFLFVLRVVGQMLVVFAGVSWLPPREEWYSGLMPYPYLLPSQWIIIVLMAMVCRDFSRGKGLFVSPRRAFGRPVLYFGYLYLAAMVVRYILRMSFCPEERWFGGTIPIFFHYVLATYVILFGRFHRAQQQRP